jgi:hypothetical protein
MNALRSKGFAVAYDPPTEGVDGEITIIGTPVTIQRCLYAGGYAVNRWSESEEAQYHYPARATVAEILCEVSAAMADPDVPA